MKKNEKQNGAGEIGFAHARAGRGWLVVVCCVDREVEMPWLSPSGCLLFASIARSLYTARALPATVVVCGDGGAKKVVLL